MTEIPAMPESLEAALTAADARLRPNNWLPPQNKIAPRIRIGRRWVNVLWALPRGATALILLIDIAQTLRELHGVQAFVKRHPRIAQRSFTGPVSNQGVATSRSGVSRCSVKGVRIMPPNYSVNDVPGLYRPICG